MKKINFLSSTKLLVATIGLIIGAFTLLSMSFPYDPAYDGPNVNGPKYSHWTTTSSGCGGSTTTYHNKTDYGKAIAKAEGSGTVSISKTGNSNTTCSNPTTAVDGSSSVTWNTGYGTNEDKNQTTDADLSKKHNNEIHLVAIPADGYMFDSWTDSNGNMVSGESECTVTASIPGASYGSKESTTYQTSSNPYTITYTAHFKEKVSATVTMSAAVGGSYTYSCIEGSGTISTVDGVVTTMNEVTFTATPAEGYSFYGWYTIEAGDVEYFSYSETCVKAFGANTTIYAKFISENAALFTIGGTTGTQYWDLNEADAAAKVASNKTIILANDGVLEPGNYTISSDVTLLIPYKSDNTKVITTPSVTTSNQHDPITPYRKLTMQDGTNIVCNGTICVGGAIASTEAGKRPTGCPTGPVGVIDMSKGGHIDLKSGATLYVWGFIVGQNYLEGNNTQNVGTITAESGSTVWEDFALSDWRGGTATNVITGAQSTTRCFPFQNYYVQNIEIPVCFKYGSTEKVHTRLYFATMKENAEVNIALIGSGNSMFTLSSGGSVTKWYDPTTDLDVFELEGNAKIDVLKVKASAFGFSMDIKSTDYDLPISSSFHIKLKDNMEVTSPIIFQPGAVFEVGPSAELKISEKLYIYDTEDWGKFVNGYYFYPLPTSLTQHRSRGTGSDKTLDDSKLIVHGKVTIATGGGLYTTTHAADIMSPDGGVIDWKVATPSDKNIYGFVSASKAEDAVAVPVTAAKLHNENDSYTASKSTTIFTNVHGRWFAGDAKNEKTNHSYDFTYLNGDADVTTEAIYWTDAAGDGHWNNATTDGVTAYANTWVGTEEDAGITAYYCYTTYDQEGTAHSGWVKLTQIGTSANFGGSDNNMYMYVDGKWQSIGSTDSDCLYTVGGVRQALVGSTLVAISKNTAPEDGAWHATANPTNYYVDLTSGSCIWAPATKVAGVEKAYVIGGTTYLRYDADGMGEDWMAVEYEAPFYYTVDDQNLRTYYEYNAGAGVWQLAAPKVRVSNQDGSAQYFFWSDAIAVANTLYNPTITLLADLEEKPVSELTISSTVKSTAYTIDLNGHSVTMTRAITGTSTAGVGNRFLNITSNMAVKIMDSSAEQNGQIRCLATGNAYARGITVTDGSLTLESGKLYVQNDAPYASNSSERVYAVVVAAGKTFTMNGGEIEAASEYYGWGVVGSGSASARSIINMNGGVINANAYYNAEGIYSTADVNMNGGTVNATTGPMFSKATGHQYAYGIYVNASPNATESSAYHGKLTMTGGTVNAYAVSNYAYGVYVHGAAATMTTSKANISSAEAVINGGTINATSKTTTVYGVFIYGGPNSYSKMADVKTVINNATINATGTATVYGIFVNAAVADLNGGLLYGIAEINDCNVTATSTSSTNAYGVYVTAASRMMNKTTYSQVSASNKKTWCYKGSDGNIDATEKNTYTYQNGYYGCGAKATINGGTFTAITKTYNAYGAYCAASTLRGQEDTTTPTVEGRGTLIIHGGTFNGKSTTYNSYGVFSSGVTTIDAGTFNATPGSYGAYGAYADRGTMDITGGTYNATAETTTACGIGATGWIDGGRGIVGHAVVIVDGVVVNAKTKTKDTAYGVLANATTKELTEATYAARSASDKNYYYTSTTNAATANYYFYRLGNYAEGGELIVNGGTFNVEAATTTALGAYCAQSALIHTTEVGCTALGKGTLTINGGTFISETKGTTTAECVRSYGNTTVNNGTFTATSKTNTAYGVRVLDGTTTVNGGTFNAIATTSSAYGVYATAEVEANYGYPRAAIAYVNGGTFNVETKGGNTAYGAFSNTIKKAAFKPAKMTVDVYTVDMALAAQLTVTDGTFNVKASTNKEVYGIAVQGTMTQGTATASAKATIEGGLFNINGATSSSAIVSNQATAENFTITGGHYSANTNLSKYVAAPNRVLDCQEPALMETYPYEVAEGYKVTFKNGTTILQEGYVKVGMTPAYAGATPTKTADAQYTYTFSAWSPALVAVSNADQVYTAQFNSALRSYTIIWQDEDGTELSREDVNFGIVPSHDALTKAETAEYTYEWNGWNNEVVAVTGPATYKSLGFTATPKSYTLTWNLNGGNITTSGTAAGSVEYGTALVAPILERTGYTYTWDPAVPATMPAANATYTAQWTANQYTITFNSNGGSAVASIIQDYNTPVTAPADPTREGYTFAGWSEPVPSTMPAENKTLTASWTINKYTITFANIDGNGGTSEVEYEYGATPSYDGTPAKAEDATNTYEFTGWDKGFATVTEATTYTAQFEAHKKIHTPIDIVAGDGNHGTAEGPTNIETETEATNMTVHTDGVVNMKKNVALTGDFILEATETTSGQVTPYDEATLTAANAYFDFTFNAAPMKWYAFAVPFEVESNDGVNAGEMERDYDIIEYHGDVRATNGANKSAWQYVAKNATLVPGKFYMILFAKATTAVRFTKKSGSLILNNQTPELYYNGGTGLNDNWNGIANPSTYHTNVIPAGVTEGQVYVSETGQYETKTLSGFDLTVGRPIFIQATSTAPVVLATPSASAPARVMAGRTIDQFDLYIAPVNNEKYSDRLIVKASEDATGEYTIVADLAKAGISQKVAQIWINAYGAKLCKQTAQLINNNAEYSISLSAPAAGEYKLYVGDMPEDGSQLYLTYDNAPIWNLSMSEYILDLKKGENTGYGLRLVGPTHITTDMEKVGTDIEAGAQKIIWDNKLFVITPSGMVYDAQGKMIKK